MFTSEVTNSTICHDFACQTGLVNLEVIKHVCYSLTAHVSCPVRFLFSKIHLKLLCSQISATDVVSGRLLLQIENDGQRCDNATDVFINEM